MSTALYTSALSDTVPLYPGCAISSLYPGHGIRGAMIPVTGTLGGSVFAEATTIDPEKEYRLELLTTPVNATINEDGSGSGTLTQDTQARMYADGVEVP
jgi:hypothetical protein